MTNNYIEGLNYTTQHPFRVEAERLAMFLKQPHTK